MGLVYDVIFKPPGLGDVTETGTTAAVQPEWVLDNRDGGTLVWRRRYDRDVRRRRVEFLDAVQVRVFERDDYGETAAGGRFDGDYDDDDYGGDGHSKTLFYRDDRHVYGPVLITVLALCIGVAYLFAPVRWLFHQLLVD